MNCTTFEIKKKSVGNLASDSNFTVFIFGYVLGNIHQILSSISHKTRQYHLISLLYNNK